MRRLLAHLLLGVTPLLLSAQNRVGDWNSFTSFLDIRETMELSPKVICATSGGILIFDRAANTFETITNVDGLAETDLSTLNVDRNGHLWLGSAPPLGIVQTYDLERKRSVKVYDFELSEIADIAISDSVVFVSYLKNLDWGILEFVYREGEFIYRQIYNPSTERLEFIADMAVRGDSLFVATDRGIFVGDFRRFILNYPQNWTALERFSGSPVTTLRNSGSEMLIVANGRVWAYSDSPILLSAFYANTGDLLDVARAGDGSLYGITPKKLVHFEPGGGVNAGWITRGRPRRLVPSSDGNLLVATDHGFGIWKADKERFEWHTPNSPAANVYTALTVLDDGRLVATGKDAISVLNENGWYNIIPSGKKWALYGHEPEDYAEFVADTVQFRASRVWSVLGWGDTLFFSLQGVYPATNDFGQPIGGGLISIDLGDPGTLVVHDTSGGHIAPYNESGYMNVRGLFRDSDNNLWISNFGAGEPDKKITVLTADGEWFHIPQLGSGGILQTLDNPTDIVVAEEGIVLIGSSKDDGLFVLDLDQDSDGDGTPDALDSDDDNNGIPDTEDWDDDGDGIGDQDDDIPVTWRNFSTNAGLASSTIWSLVSAEPGMAWVLTAQGLQRLTFNSDYSSVTPYFFTYFSGVPFGEGSKVVVDSRGNVWISSVTNGLYVLLENATPWPDWGGFRHNNSYLLSDQVTAVAFDNKRGIAYIATSKGINSLRTPFAERKESYHGVRAFPSPFRIPSATPMVIDGLMDNSSLKIMTLSGRVLREIKSSSPSVQGYQAFWDGKTDDDKYVGTGVYLVAVYSDKGESHVMKIAVIRR